MKREFSRVVERIARTMRVFFDRDLEQVEVLSTGFLIVWLVNEQQHVSVSPNFGDAIRSRIFVAGMVPTISVPRMDLLVLKYDAASPIESVTQARGLWCPPPLDLGPPPWLQNLIEI